MSNELITDEVGGVRRIYYAYGNSYKKFGDKRKTVSITYAYSLAQSAKMTFDWVMQKMMNEVLEEQLKVTVNIGLTFKNPKDTPNLKLARATAKTRMIEKPFPVEFTVNAFEAHGSVIIVSMHRVRLAGDDLNGLPSYLSLEFEKGNTDEMKAYKLKSENFRV